MEKVRKVIIILLLIIFVSFILTQYVYAAKRTTNLIKVVKFSDEFNEWRKLSDSEKNTVMLPKLYDELNTNFQTENPLYNASLVGASVNSSYSLKEDIPDNLAIRNQYSTNSCWAFAGLSSLETNLALSNYMSGDNIDKVYDFSERHANYSATRNFLNGKENIFGYNRNASTGGQWHMIENYLTNGQGAIAESDMPFEDNSNDIDISNIQNKNVISKVYDTVYFDNYNDKSGVERTEIMDKIKQHIQNYGSVFATIHGANPVSIDNKCYDNSTGAKNCNSEENHPVDHAVSIVGWDDNYNVTKFPETSRPTLNGAWIARNSWGEIIEYDLNKFKEELYNMMPDKCKELGWNTPRRYSKHFYRTSWLYNF